jgi:hypothetical protein
VPFLALGAELGLWFGLLCALALPGVAPEPQGFALAGMATLFTAIVRAPLTAIRNAARSGSPSTGHAGTVEKSHVVRRGARWMFCRMVAVGRRRTPFEARVDCMAASS